MAVELRVSTISFVPKRGNDEKRNCDPHTKSSEIHPAGNSRCSDCSVAQQLMPAKIRNANPHPRTLNFSILLFFN